MGCNVEQRLASLRGQYREMCGGSFKHFLCPITFRDEESELCCAHIANTAFDGADGRWTVQRKDVDNFFGHVFESEFTLLDEKRKHDVLDVLTDRGLSRKLWPQLLIDGRRIEHYLPDGPVPSNHSELLVEREGQSPVRVALKIAPSETLSLEKANWEVGFQRDVRLSALVAVLKAAHLTLFEILGYQYALSAGGHFLGHSVLGTFFLENSGRDQPAIRQHARGHFRQFANLARPIISTPVGLHGTINDGHVYLCTTATGRYWALMVFVRSGAHWHAALVPVLESEEAAVRLVALLDAPPKRLYAKRARHVDGRWEVARTEEEFEWPEGRLEDTW